MEALPKPHRKNAIVIYNGQTVGKKQDESPAGNPDEATKFFVEKARETNALRRATDKMQLEDIRERLLHEENTQVRNARDYYESVKSKNESKEIQDGAYNLLLLAVADIDEKRRVFNDARTIKALAPILESKITIREGSNLEKDLSGDYIRRAGDYEKRNAGSVKIPGEYASIETSTKERKELFEKIRNEIRKRNRQNNRMGQSRSNQGGFSNAKNQRITRGHLPTVSIIRIYDNSHKRGGKTPDSVCPLSYIL